MCHACNVTSLEDYHGNPWDSSPGSSWCRKRHFDQKNQQFQRDVVETHNWYRRNHRTPPLQLSSRLSEIAQSWADYLALTYDVKHSNHQYNGQPLGENVARKFCKHDEKYTGEDVTEQWYSEKMLYTFDTCRPYDRSDYTGHFTQLVWKSSRHLGVGVSRGRDGSWIVVCNYFPAGNIPGGYQANVRPPTNHEMVRLSAVKRVNKSSDWVHSSATSTSEVDMTRVHWPHTYVSADSKANRTLPAKLRTDYVAQSESKSGLRKSELGDTAWKTPTSPIEAGSGSHSAEVAESAGTVWDDKAILGPEASQFSQEPPEMQCPKVKCPTEGGGFSAPENIVEFRQSALTAHNKYRARHGVPSLLLASDLCEHAQKWAENLAEKETVQHSDRRLNGEEIGENVACFSNTAYRGPDVVELWYKEGNDYDYSRGQGDATSQGSNFTQVIWKSTKEMGIGRAISASGKYFIVGHYRPTGNQGDQFCDNVLPVISH